jgi:hypothetical protein
MVEDQGFVIVMFGVETTSSRLPGLIAMKGEDHRVQSGFIGPSFSSAEYKNAARRDHGFLFSRTAKLRDKHVAL